VQTREDGLSIDQIVLSPVTYATRAPGAGKNDTTIVAEAGAATTSTTSSTTSSSGFTWTSLVKASASGAKVTKTSGCTSCGDAGAVGTQRLTSGSVSFTVSGGMLEVGLGTDTTASTNYATIDYGFNFASATGWDIREKGVYRTEGAYTASDVFKIAIDGTAVKYYKNGTLVYTSKTPVPGALAVDATLVTLGSAVQIVDSTATATTTTTPTAPTTTTTAPPPTTTTTTTTTTGTTFKILQWNIHHGGFGTDNVYSPDRVATWVAKMNPDVVMFNEVEKNTYWGNQDQPEVYKALLQQKTGKTWYYVAAQEYGQWTSNGKTNVIFSSVPISYANRYEFVHNADRSVAEAEITWNGRRITLMSTHLDPYDQALRLTQAQEFTSWASAEPENKILTGDMNAWPDQSSIQHLNTVFYDSWTVAGQNGTATAFSGNYGETKNGRIDYIFYSKASSSLVVKASQVVDTRDANGVMPSDHRPVLTTFTVK